VCVRWLQMRLKPKRAIYETIALLGERVSLRQTTNRSPLGFTIP